MKFILGMVSAAAYAGTRILAGAVGGTVLAVVLTYRTRRQHPRGVVMTTKGTPVPPDLRTGGPGALIRT